LIDSSASILGLAIQRRRAINHMKIGIFGSYQDDTYDLARKKYDAYTNRKTNAEVLMKNIVHIVQGQSLCGTKERETVHMPNLVN